MAAARMNEAELDEITNRVLGFGLFDKHSAPSRRAAAALSGDRTALRLVVKDVARAAPAALTEKENAR